ncbi:hypothetical protein DKT68_20215 [Micromonospora acroterricola]|uniref:PPE family protein n=1 Tax=Micromonospora acroterricola TaxID=2202421 RepID=A0A317CXY0_9ACTN|nr:hypothetical protein [Micromonospora acroterricola]PWR07102.1 hypothetical protein DKT68_20215 [Micromonospora acroterricola]
MIERGSGRTSGATDWQLMDVNSMWACLQDHDTANHWKQVAGWRKVCDLAQIHLGRLQEYRRGLAEAWPPETSAASGTYLAQLDELIDKVRHTHDAAAANYTALSAATQAIGTTRAELRRVYEEYATKLQQKQAYDATAADPKAVMGSRVTESPVTDAELERLNVQARAMMFNLSGELQQAHATLQKPPPPPPRPRRDPSTPDAYDAGTAPVIPPIVSVPIATNSAPRKPSLPPQAGTQPVQATPAVGPILGSAAAGVAPPPTSAGFPGVAGPNPATGVGPPPAPPPGSITPSRVTHQAPQGTTGSGGRPIGGNANGVSPIQPSPQTRSMPPNGLIGGAPGLGLGQPASGASPTRRVNPIGGVIGGGGAGTAPTGGAGSRPGGGRGLAGGHNFPPIGGAPGFASPTGAGPSASFPPGRPDHHGHEDDKRAWDPDNPWEVDEGVNPVVRPPEEQGPPDPGPAIGFNR